MKCFYSPKRPQERTSPNPPIQSNVTVPPLGFRMRCDVTGDGLEAARCDDLR